jgi:flagellar protein FlaG
MSKVISTALLTIAAVIASVAMINAVMPAIGRGSSALVAANHSASERIKTDIEIVFVYGDTTNNEIVFWVKNVGNSTIESIENSGVYLTTPTTASRIPYGSGTEYWDYIIEDNESKWSRWVTLKVTLHLTSVSTGMHRVKLVTPRGASAEKEFSI